MFVGAFVKKGQRESKKLAINPKQTSQIQSINQSMISQKFSTKQETTSWSQQPRYQPMYCVPFCMYGPSPIVCSCWAVDWRRPFSRYSAPPYGAVYLSAVCVQLEFHWMDQISIAVLEVSRDKIRAPSSHCKRHLSDNPAATNPPSKWKNYYFKLLYKWKICQQDSCLLHFR